MTTATFSTVVDHSTDAAFRTWGLELNTQIASTVTMVQTADTGQVNWTTVTRAGVNAEAGYEIWKLNDALFGSAPVYFRIGYGTGGTTATPRLQITLGTGTNGAGTLTGTALTTARTINANLAPTSTATAYASYACSTEGFFGLSWKGGTSNTQNACRGSFTFQRSVDTAGAISVQGGMVIWGNGATSAFTALQNLRFAATANAYAAIVGTLGSFPCVIPGAVTSSTVGANFQAYLHFTALPDEIPLIGTCTALISEVAVASTFSVALVASVSHTYIQLGQISTSETLGSATYGFCMRWE